MDKKALGSWGEKQAADFLKSKGYRILETNYSRRIGEIDIIASDRKHIVFAEVKLRKNADFAEAREFVTPAKQRRIRGTAMLWLAGNTVDLQPRFDVIEVYASDGNLSKSVKINHIENAFE